MIRRFDECTHVLMDRLLGADRFDLLANFGQLRP